MSRGGYAPVLRLARRNAVRHPWRSLLIMLLVLLPVAAMVGAATVIRTVTPTPERSATHRMGEADLLVYGQAEGATDEALRAALPNDSVVERLWTSGERLVLPGYSVSVTRMAVNLEGLGRGMLALVSGRLPAGAGEVAISAPVAELAGAGTGDVIQLHGLEPLTIVGLVEDELNLKARVVLADAALGGPPEAGSTWLAALPDGVDPADLHFPVDAALADGSSFQAISRASVVQGREEPSPTIVVLAALALVETALVASAAFAVSIRRRQRELGLLASAGAGTRHLAGTVLAEGLVLGGVGSLLGVAAGVAAALASSPWLDGLTDHRNPPVVPALDIVAVSVAAGVFAVIAAALAPSWTAARVPVLTALSGRRPPMSPAHRTLALGVALIGVAIGLTMIGASLRLQGDSGLSLAMLVLGAVLGTLGFGAASPWLLERLERIAPRLPVAERIALRDTARARSRNGPIVTALLASFAATVAFAAYQASTDAEVAANWRPWMRADQVYLQGTGAALAGEALAEELGAIAAAPVPYSGSEDRSIWISPPGEDDPNLGIQFVSIGDGDLLRALGAEEAVQSLEAGAVVITGSEMAGVDRVTLHVATLDTPSSATADVAAVTVGTVPAGTLPAAVVSSATAARLGVVAPETSERFLVRLARPVTEGDLARAGAAAARYPDTWADAATGPQRPGAAFRWLLIVASLLLALGVTAVAVALGEAESRPDQRTLLAVGADPSLRRRVAGARAAALTVLAGVLAVPAGLLPAWGLLASRGSPLVVPVPEVLAALALLPLLAVAGSRLLTRPIPTWSAFRDLSSS